MSLSITHLNEPLPEWLWDIKQEAFKKICQTNLIRDCRNGNREAMKILMIRFRSFVEGINGFNHKGWSSAAFLRLAAVEVVAEGISLYLKNEFKKINDPTGCFFWGQIQLYKEGCTLHQYLFYQMAFLLACKELEKDEVNEIIQNEVVNWFVDFADTPY